MIYEREYLGKHIWLWSIINSRNGLNDGKKWEKRQNIGMKKIVFQTRFINPNLYYIAIGFYLLGLVFYVDDFGVCYRYKESHCRMQRKHGN